MTPRKHSAPDGAIHIAGEMIEPGEQRQIEIPVARLPPTRSHLSIPVEVLNGSRPGARLWLSAAVHGDELNGVAIVHEVLERVREENVRGVLVAVPVVNVFGVINQSRYLPDRRDLNRSFPGSARGSLASRLAHIFMQEIVSNCTHGIDFHTGSDHRENLPQIRCDLLDPETRRCAEAFRAPVTIHSSTRDGSLRQAATARGIPVLLFEGGETQRFNPRAVRAGVEGVLRVMRALRMIGRTVAVRRGEAGVIARKTVWVRARKSGICRLHVRAGEVVQRKDRLCEISDTFGDSRVSVAAPEAGLVIGVTRNPLVRQGDGVVHLALDFERENDAEAR